MNKNFNKHFKLCLILRAMQKCVKNFGEAEKF